MKKQRILIALATIVLTLTSCQIERRHYMPGYNSFGSSFVNNKTVSVSGTTCCENIIEESFNGFAPDISEKHVSEAELIKEKCDTIYLTNGEIIAAEIVSSDSACIKYRHCNTGDKIIYTIKKEKVLNIQSFNEENKPAPALVADQVTEPLGVTGFILSILSFPLSIILIESDFIALWFLSSTIAVTLCIISLGLIKKHKEKYKGVGFPAFGIAISLFTFAVAGLIALLTIALY